MRESFEKRTRERRNRRKRQEAFRETLAKHSKQRTGGTVNRVGEPIQGVRLRMMNTRPKDEIKAHIGEVKDDPSEKMVELSSSIGEESLRALVEKPHDDSEDTV